MLKIDNNDLTYEQKDVMESVKKNDVAINSYHEISSLSEMSSYLEKLQRESSGAVAEAVNAQFAVVRFVQSPTLNDTLLDTLLMGLETAISYSQSEEDKAIYRRHFALMIQNYVFFLDAKIQYEVNQHHEEAYRLLDHAGEMLSKSVVNIAELYATKGKSALKGGMANLVVKNVFAQENDKEKKSFLKKCFEWYNRSSRIKKKKDDFYDTIENFYYKLDEYSDLIGPSIAIKGMLDRFSGPLSDYKYEEIISYFEDAKAHFNPLSFWWIIVFGMLFLLVRFIWSLIMGIWYGINFNWLLSHCLWTIGAAFAYVIILRIYVFFKFDNRIARLRRAQMKYQIMLIHIADKFKR